MDYLWQKQRMQPTGFTLIELMVVIGIISVVISIVLPTVSRVRSQASRAVCLSNLRQIGQMAQVWASTHNGYLPLDGHVKIPVGVSLPDGLADPSRKKYGYTVDDGSFPLSNDPPTKESPTPFLVAILNETFTPTMKWSERIDPFYKRTRVMQCPAADHNRENRWAFADQGGVGSLVLQVGNRSLYSPWFTSFDFATNGHLLGYNRESSRIGGHASKVKYASKVVVCGDAETPFMNWLPVISSGEVTMADVMKNRVSINTSLTGIDSLDGKRHRGMVNFLFLDWHADAYRFSEQELTQAVLAPK